MNALERLVPVTELTKLNKHIRYRPFLKLVREGKVPRGVAVHIGSRVFIDIVVFEAWMATGGTAESGGAGGAAEAAAEAGR